MALINCREQLALDACHHFSRQRSAISLLLEFRQQILCNGFLWRAEIVTSIQTNKIAKAVLRKEVGAGAGVDE